MKLFMTGAHLGMLIVKAAIVGLLLNYRISVCDKTPKSINLSKKGNLKSTEDGIFVKFEKRHKWCML